MNNKKIPPLAKAIGKIVLKGFLILSESFK